MIKDLPAMQETWVRPLGQKDPLEKDMAIPPVFLPGEFLGQRSLESYSSRNPKDSDTAEGLTLTQTKYAKRTLEPERMLQKTILPPLTCMVVSLRELLHVLIAFSI